MPPLRTIPTTKPIKTERSHEENQERAYIAASRRRDRNLEARVESARRASEIHEKRTGRKLRVTEQDVINEEMYEEEDENIPWRYRHLALLPNLSTLSPEFRRRIGAQLVLEMERSRMVDSNGPFQSPGPYMNPSMMQMQQPGQQSSRSPSSHRQTPYSIPNGQQCSLKHSPHQQSAPIATLQHQPTESIHAAEEISQMKDRRTSLPRQTVKAQIAPSPNSATPSGQSPTTSGDGPISQHSHKLQTQAPTLSMQGHARIQRQYCFAGPFYGSPTANESMNNRYAPLTPTLPMNMQQLLGDGMFGFMDDPKSVMKPNASGTNLPMYNYDPSGNRANSKKRKFEDTKCSPGLDQNPMPTALETSIGESIKATFFNASSLVGSNLQDSAVTEPASVVGFDDNEFGFDPFTSSQSSGQPSPAEFTSFVDDELFGDQQFGF